MAADETIRLNLDMGTSSADVRKVEEDLTKLKTTVLSTADAYDVLERQVGEYAIEVHKETTALDQQVRKAHEATQAQNALHRALTETTVVTTAAIGQGVRGGTGGRGVLGLSYAFQDFTSVLSMGGGLERALFSISNNIDQMALSLGASVSMAAKLSLGFTAFATALPILTPLFKSLWEAMAGKSTNQIIETFDEVEKRVKQLTEQLEGLRKGLTDEATDEQTMKGFFALQGEGFLGNVVKALVATGRGEATDPEFLRNVAETRRLTQFAEPETRAKGAVRIRELTDVESQRQYEINLKRAEALIREAPGSAQAQAEMMALGREAPGIMGRRFAGHMGEVTPAALRQQEAAIAKAEMGEEMIAENLKARTAHNKRSRELTETGRENERLMREAADKDIPKITSAQVKEMEAAAEAKRDKFREFQQRGIVARQMMHAGQEATPQEIREVAAQQIAVMKARNAALLDAQQGFIKANIDAAAGSDQQIQQLRQGARALRQRRPAGGGDGMPG